MLPCGFLSLISADYFKTFLTGLTGWCAEALPSPERWIPSLTNSLKTSLFCCQRKSSSYHLSAKKGSHFQGLSLCLLSLCARPEGAQPFSLPHLLMQSFVFCLRSGERQEDSSLVQYAFVSIWLQPPGRPSGYQMFTGGLPTCLAWFAHLRCIETVSARPELNFGSIDPGCSVNSTRALDSPGSPRVTCTGLKSCCSWHWVLFLYLTNLEFCILGLQHWLNNKPSPHRQDSLQWGCN